jgi:hypothetical protein
MHNCFARHPTLTGCRRVLAFSVRLLGYQHGEVHLLTNVSSFFRLPVGFIKRRRNRAITLQADRIRSTFEVRTPSEFGKGFHGFVGELHTNLTPDQEKCCAPIGHKEKGRTQVTKRKTVRIDHLSKLKCRNMVLLAARRAILMHSMFQHFTPLLLAVSLASPIAMIGCQSQPDTSPETVIYTQWEHDTNRQHQDLNKRPPAEQKEYSDWRGTRHK